jgi:alkylated DNA repair dioxygenase AlkB
MTKIRTQFAGALLQDGDVLVAGGASDDSWAPRAAADIGEVAP